MKVTWVRMFLTHISLLKQVQSRNSQTNIVNRWLNCTSKVKYMYIQKKNLAVFIFHVLLYNTDTECLTKKRFKWHFIINRKKTKINELRQHAVRQTHKFCCCFSHRDIYFALYALCLITKKFSTANCSHSFTITGSDFLFCFSILSQQNTLTCNERKKNSNTRKKYKKPDDQNHEYTRPENKTHKWMYNFAKYTLITRLVMTTH